MYSFTLQSAVEPALKPATPKNWTNGSGRPAPWLAVKRTPWKLWWKRECWTNCYPFWINLTTLSTLLPLAIMLFNSVQYHFSKQEFHIASTSNIYWMDGGLPASILTISSRLWILGLGNKAAWWGRLSIHILPWGKSNLGVSFSPRLLPSMWISRRFDIQFLRPQLQRARVVTWVFKVLKISRWVD